MGFGNPYGDPYDESIVYEWVNKMAEIDIRIISLADTVGLATKEQVRSITKYVIGALPHIETGVHLHSAPHNRKEKLDAAIYAGCGRFDAAIKGIGGCPMTRLTDPALSPPGKSSCWQLRHLHVWRRVLTLRRCPKRCLDSPRQGGLSWSHLPALRPRSYKK